MPRDLLFSRRSPMPVSPAELFEWHARPGAFTRLVPPWERVEVVGPAPEIVEGSRVVLRMARGPLRLRWVAEHRRVAPGEGFRDVQVEGPFALWEHDHLFEPRDGGGALLHDRIRFRPPLGPLGRLLMGRTMRRDLERTFRYRHDTTAADLGLHARFRERPRLRVGITGADGLIGGTLTALLTTGGHEAVRLPLPGPAGGRPDAAPLEGLDAVVHLAGGELVSALHRAASSPVEATRGLIDLLGRLDRPPATLVSASSVGIYGDRGEPVDEQSGPGDGQLAGLCVAWEKAALAAASLGPRVVLARLGAVLSPAGGPLRRLLPLFRCGLGARLGDGCQRPSWISVDDAAAALLHLLMVDVEGPVNLAAPEAPSNRELTALLASLLRRPAMLPLPAAAVRLRLGRPAAELLLDGPEARPIRLQEAGFVFRHPRLETALRHLLGRQPG